MSIPDRRMLLFALASASVAWRAAFAEPVTELGWDDLLPATGDAFSSGLRGVIEHEAAGLATQQPALAGVRTDWNGQTVSLSGYIIPLDYSGTGVTTFLLVPYVGACIHVPAPPANQLVLVTTPDPYESKGLFEAVTITGMFGTAATSTQLAEVGYALSAERIEPHRW